MKFSLTLDIEDYLSYHLFQASKSRILKKRRIRNWALVPAVYFISGILLMLLKGSEMVSLIFYVTGVLWIVLYPFYSRWAIPRYMKRQIAQKYANVAGKEGELEITKSAIIISNDGNSLKKNIPDVVSIVNLPGYYIIELGDRGPTGDLDLILPKNKVSHKTLNDLIQKISTQTGIKVEDQTSWKWK